MLNYRDEGRGLPLVLLHPFPFDSTFYSPQFEALTQKLRVIAPDLRGFGKTPPKGTVTMDAHALDVVALLDKLGIDQAVIGGLSMGGYVSLAMLRVDASRVKGLILMNTQATADDSEAKAKRLENADRVSREGAGFFVEAQRDRLVAKSARPDVRAKVARIMSAQPTEGVVGGFRGMAERPDSRDMLARFSGPALIIVGEEDQITPLAKAKQMQSLVKDSTLLEVKGAGHLASLEDPPAVNRAIADFCRSL